MNWYKKANNPNKLDYLVAQILIDAFNGVNSSGLSKIKEFVSNYRGMENINTEINNGVVLAMKSLNINELNASQQNALNEIFFEFSSTNQYNNKNQIEEEVKNDYEPDKISENPASVGEQNNIK